MSGHPGESGTGLLRRGCLYGDTAAIEIEVQQPHPGALSVCRSELPLSGGIAGNAGEVPARPGTFQEFTDDIARGTNEHAHCDFDMAANPVAYALWNVRTYFVEYGERIGRRRGRRLIQRTRSGTRQLRS